MNATSKLWPYFKGRNGIFGTFVKELWSWDY